MFSQVSVNLLNGVCLVPCSFSGDGYLWYQVPSGGGGYVWGRGAWVCPGVSTHPNNTPPPTPEMGPGIPRDTVGKQVVCILMECFLVFKIFCELKTKCLKERSDLEKRTME